MGLSSKFTRDAAIAFHAGWDAGNESAKRAGRTQWNDEDFDAAVKAFEDIWPKDDTQASNV